MGLEALQFGGEGLFMKLSALGNTLIWLLLGHRKGLFGGGSHMVNSSLGRKIINIPGRLKL